MNTITKEWLQKAINDYESVRDELPFGLDDYQGKILAALRIALASLEAEAVTPSDVTGPLAHAYKELTPTFMRNHIDVFERYGIYPDGSAGIQAMRIALDGMSRRAAMLQSFGNSEQLNSPVIPDGWVLVPVEPTYQMCEAMGVPWESPRFPDRYKAMIAAAPQQEAE